MRKINFINIGFRILQDNPNNNSFSSLATLWVTRIHPLPCFDFFSKGSVWRRRMLWNDGESASSYQLIPSRWNNLNWGQIHGVGGRWENQIWAKFFWVLQKGIWSGLAPSPHSVRTLFMMTVAHGAAWLERNWSQRKIKNLAPWYSQKCTGATSGVAQACRVPHPALWCACYTCVSPSATLCGTGWSNNPFL